MAVHLALTWHRDKELDSIPVSMEAELGLGHGAVRNDAAWRHRVRLVVTVHTNHATRPAWRGRSCHCLLVTWYTSRQRVNSGLKVIPRSPVYLSHQHQQSKCINLLHIFHDTVSTSFSAIFHKLCSYLTF